MTGTTGPRVRGCRATGRTDRRRLLRIPAACAGCGRREAVQERPAKRLMRARALPPPQPTARGCPIQTRGQCCPRRQGSRAPPWTRAGCAIDERAAAYGVGQDRNACGACPRQATHRAIHASPRHTNSCVEGAAVPSEPWCGSASHEVAASTLSQRRTINSALRQAGPSGMART